jgi:hypothetical protein
MTAAQARPVGWATPERVAAARVLGALAPSFPVFGSWPEERRPNWGTKPPESSAS